MAKKFYQVAKLVREGKAPSQGIWVMLPNATIFGELLSDREAKKRLEDIFPSSGTKNELEDAMESISYKFMYDENASDEPEAASEEIVTLMFASVYAGELTFDTQIVHICADTVMAWGPGRHFLLSEAEEKSQLSEVPA